MAQINVEHKQKSPWFWIIAVIVAIIIIWVLIELFSHDEPEVLVPPPAQSSLLPSNATAPAASVAAYLAPSKVFS